jgi:cyanophycinase
MAEPDLRAIARAGGPDAPIAVLPTAAAPDRNEARAGRNAVRWFRSLGASQVDVVAVVDPASANDASLAAQLRQARLIYMLGGFPGYLAETLRGSLCWGAVLQAHAAGAVLGGSSAGAMVLCSHYYDPQSSNTRVGLDLLPGCCVIPHHDRFGGGWIKELAERLPGSILIGIDERTGMLSDASGLWTASGAGKVTLYDHGRQDAYAQGESFRLHADRGTPQLRSFP